MVISIEGLSTALVGAYGSNTAETKTLDSIAACGIVLDQCYLDSRNLDQMLISLWTGQHAMVREHCMSSGSSKLHDPVAGDVVAGETLWHVLERSGHAVVFVTDCPKTAALAEKCGCSRVLLVEAAVPTQPAEEVMLCAAMSLFSAAAEAMEQLDTESSSTKLCWIHTRGLYQPWDAPLDLRARFADSDDPDPPSEVGPPQMVVDQQTDPDLVVGWIQVAGAQASVLDQGIELLRDFIDQLDNDWSWCILGIDAYPLGELGRIGRDDGAMESRALGTHHLQVAAIFSPEPELPIGWRVDQICQLPDVAVSIAELCGIRLCGIELYSDVHDGEAGSSDEIALWGRSQLGAPEDQSAMQWNHVHQLACLVEGEQSWLRTPAWSMRTKGPEAGPDNELLFVQPDDHWEISEVGSRCRDVLEQLVEVRTKFIEAAKVGRRDLLPKLDELHCNLLR